MSFVDRPDSLAQAAYKSIRRAIRSGGLTHDQLYSENGLAMEMGISRTPVREALIELEREGLVRIAPQRGFQLRELSNEEEQEVFALRGVLESFVAAQVARSVTPDDVAQLTRILDEQERLLDDWEPFLACDEQFHLLLPRLAKLERAHQMLVSLRGAMWLMGSQALATPQRAPEVLREHRAIVIAIAAGDPDGAARASELHIKSTAAVVGRRWLGSAPTDDALDAGGPSE